uniref:TNFR-Cys domain-containing protein n=1 Tax=Biomphalaria glabrata TaxID=6526 RepID=A0A2C9KEZ9_BIOGL
MYSRDRLVLIFLCLNSCTRYSSGESDPDEHKGTDLTRPQTSGDCPPMKWGERCLQPCSNGCFNFSCEKTTGLCNKGCMGYSNPPLCDEVCHNNTFGKNCLRSCDKECTSVDRSVDFSCHHVSGKCLLVDFAKHENAYHANENGEYSQLLVGIGAIGFFALLMALTVLYAHNANIYRRKETDRQSDNSSVIDLPVLPVLPTMKTEKSDSQMNFFRGSSTSFDLQVDNDTGKETEV